MPAVKVVPSETLGGMRDLELRVLSWCSSAYAPQFVPPRRRWDVLVSYYVLAAGASGVTSVAPGVTVGN